MIMLGKNIIMPNDPLEKITLEQLKALIDGGNRDIQQQVETLRSLKIIDKEAYKKNKRYLPYFTVAVFAPPFRKTENVAYAEYLILDVDNIDTEKHKIEDLKRMLFEQIPQVTFIFISPGANGLKLLFKLSERIYDPYIYKLLFKTFAIECAQQFGLQGYMDIRTCDITRANFLSYDPQILYRPDAPVLDVKKYVNTEHTNQLVQIEKHIEQYEDELPQPDRNETEMKKNDLSDELLAQIKEKLLPTTRKPQKPPPYVPEQLNQAIDGIVNEIQKHSLTINSVQNIQYGKKLRISLQNRWAEVNVFYGKKGFSVVKTPKNGSDYELADVVFQIIRQHLLLE